MNVLRKIWFDFLEVIIVFIFSLRFLFLFSGSWNDFIINLCFALMSFLLAVVAICIIIGLCNALAGLIER